MAGSGQLRIEIKSFSQGSVVVNFIITFTPSQSQDINNVSTALLHSLQNSTKYTVDENNTSIKGMSLSVLCFNNVFYETRAGRYETPGKCRKPLLPRKT